MVCLNHQAKSFLVLLTGPQPETYAGYGQQSAGCSTHVIGIVVAGEDFFSHLTAVQRVLEAGMLRSR